MKESNIKTTSQGPTPLWGGFIWSNCKVPWEHFNFHPQPQVAAGCWTVSHQQSSLAWKFFLSGRGLTHVLDPCVTVGSWILEKMGHFKLREP